MKTNSFDVTIILVNVIPLLLFGISIFLFVKADSSKVKSKNLSLVMVGLGINLITMPMALFIGGMATDAPTSTMTDFWKGFWFIQAVPFLILLVALANWFIRRRYNYEGRE